MKVVKIYLKAEQTKILQTLITEAGEVEKLETTRALAIPSKKNQQTPIVNKHTGKAFIKQSDQYSKWVQLTKPFWEQQYLKLYDKQISLPIARCRVNIKFYFADEISRDCTNKGDTIMDSLVQHKIIFDDSFIVTSDVHLQGWLCRDRPRTEIYISILSPEDAGYNYDVTDYKRWNEMKKEKRAKRYQFNKKKRTVGAENPEAL